MTAPSKGGVDALPKLMRGTLAAGILGFMLCCASGAAYAEALPGTEEIGTPKQLSKFMKNHFEFAEDTELFETADYWQSPAEFLERQTGDCEDYALFAQSVLTGLGYEAQVVSFYGPGGFAHTVTVFKEKDRYHVLNGARLYRYKAKTLEEALTRVHAEWTWAGIAEKRGTRGWMNREVLNPAFA